MDIKRAIIAGVILWAAIFFEVSILMFGFGLTTGNLYYSLHYILAGILAGAAGMFYFTGKVKPGISEGAKAGIVVLAAGIALDAIITVPLFVKDYAFFLDFSMLLGYIETLAIVAAVGFVKEKKG